jgi:hypothetical protein
MIFQTNLPMMVYFCAAKGAARPPITEEQSRRTRFARVLPKGTKETGGQGLDLPVVTKLGGNLVLEINFPESNLQAVTYEMGGMKVLGDLGLSPNLT